MPNDKKRRGRKSSFFYFIDGKKFESLDEAAGAFNVSTMSVHNWCSGGKKSKANCYKVRKADGGIEPLPDQIKMPEADFYENAESYLTAVVRGETKPDSLRCQAAKVLISYQIPKKRTKVKSPTPKTLKQKEESSIEKDNLLNFERKAAKIRAKYEQKKVIK